MKCVCLLLALIFLQGSLMAQDDLVRPWNDYRQSHLYEKVYVQTDKDYYLCGELCWFKCYDVSAANLRPLSLSRVAYVEVLDGRSKPVLQAKIALDSGSGNGALYLPFTLASGSYTLRAYTRWMKNEPATYFFEKPLTILNTHQAPPTPGRITPAAHLAFFPEGGNLVSGLTSTVAFQGTDAYGEPIGFTGVLRDDRGDTVLHFQPQAQGMGRFAFTPAAGRHYTATVWPVAGGVLNIDLPRVYDRGFVMHLDTAAGGSLRVSVQSTESGRVFLLVHSNARMDIAEAAPLTNGRAVFPIDTGRLEAGIAHLTIFNDDRQPVCERLLFKSPAGDNLLGLQTDKNHYIPRSGVSIHIKAPEGITGTDLSVTAYRLDSLQGIPEQNIVNYLWLTSDLSGPVAHPAFFFDHPWALDNLLLTQGWRRFRWEDVLKDTTPVFTYAPEYKGHLITGRVVDTRTGAPGNRILAFCSAPGNRTQFATATSDSTGRLAFDMPAMYGSSQVVVQTDLSTADSVYRVDVDDPFSEVYPGHPVTRFDMPLDNPVTLTERSLSMQVQNAYAAMRMQTPYLPAAADTTAFYLHPDLTYMLDDYVRFTTMEEVLREYVQLVNVYRKGSHFHLWNYNTPRNEPFDEDPFILLDGVPIFNTDQLMAYNPLKIRRLEVLTRRYFLGGVSFTGLLNWTTYHGDLSGYQLDPHATALDYEGLQARRTFYSPIYVTDAQKASRLPDYRNVLYWDPRTSLPGGGEGVVRFFTSDLPGKYAVIVQGVSAQGVPLYGETTLEVNAAE